MSDFDDYTDDMGFNRRTDRDIERLLDGSLDTPDDLAPVSDLFTALRAEANAPLDADTHARLLRSALTAPTGDTVPFPVTARTSRSVVPGSLRRRVAAVSVALAMFAGGMTGMAAAADHSKPGDALYGLDRAFEAVGIGNGRAAERLAEVQDLFDADEVPEGLRHAAETVDSNGSEHTAASLALMEAAERVEAGSAQSDDVRVMVAGLLSYLSESKGAVDGGHVAELAREIGRPADRPGTPPAVTPSDPPGRSGDHRADPPGKPDPATGRKIPPKAKP